jgi:hypothetical protein
VVGDTGPARFVGKGLPNDSPLGSSAAIIKSRQAFAWMVINNLFPISG